MTSWLVSLLQRLRPRARRVTVGVLALLVLGAAAAIVILTLPSEVAPRSERPAARLRSSSTPANAGRKRLPAPVTAAQLVQARGVGERFLAGYLPFIYGRARAASVSAVTSGLRGELLRDRAQVTPVEARRHPRVISLQVIGKAAGVVLATAMVEDGGVTTYALRFTLERRAAGWVVSRVAGS